MTNNKLNYIAAAALTLKLMLPTPAHAMPAGIRNSPFAADATFSYEIAPNTIVINGLPIEAVLPKRAMSRALPITEGNPAAIPSPIDDIELDDEEIPGVRGVYPPSADDIPDWRSIYRIKIGVQLEGIEDFHWTQPGNTFRPFEALLHLKATFAQIRAMYLRDVGVDLQITHVHLREAKSTWPDTDNGNSHEAFLAIDNFLHAFVINDRPIVVLRLGDRIGGGKAHLSGPCYDGERGVMVSRSWYDLSIGPVQTGDNYRNVVTGIVAQELSHHILGLGHSQCYHDEAGTPIERCYEKSCYEGESACPPFWDQTFMGYCYPCGGPYGGLSDPPLRMGPWRGPLARVARLHVLQYAQDCLGDPVGQLPDDATMKIDADHDAQPDVIDNHLKFPNNEQGDWFGCAIIQPSHGVWILLLPIALLWRRK